MNKPKVFISYSHADKEWFEDNSLITPLVKAMKLEGAEVWYDTARLQAGDRFRQEILDAIDTSQIAILLISRQFLLSDFIKTVELPRIIEHANQNHIRIIPILLNYCDWNENTFLSEFQMLPAETWPLIELWAKPAERAKAEYQIQQAVVRSIRFVRKELDDNVRQRSTESTKRKKLEQVPAEDVNQPNMPTLEESIAPVGQQQTPLQEKKEKGDQAHLYSCLVWMGKLRLVSFSAVALIAIAGILFYGFVGNTPGSVFITAHLLPNGKPLIEPQVPAEPVVKETIIPEVGHHFLESAFVWCPPGQFLCGDKWDAETVARKYGESAKCYKDAPQYTASITDGFWIAAKETTVSEFETFVKETNYITNAEKSGKGRVLNILNGKWEEKNDANWRQPGWTITPDQPVVLVSWNDATAYCQWLSEKTGEIYRLPMEKEWEYACRAGTDTEFWWGNEISKGREYLNTADETDTPWGRNKWSSKFPFASGFFYVAPVGRFLPNKWGLYDMHGNVYEWCYDKYSKYPSDNTDSTSGLTTAKSDRVSRGGSWRCGPGFCRSAFRNHGPEDSADSFTGFRIVRASSSPKTEPSTSVELHDN